jgi:hypothetical protein
MALRSWQFRLSTLFVAVTACAVICAFPKVCSTFLFLLGGTITVGSVLIVTVFVPIYIIAQWLTRDRSGGKQKSLRFSPPAEKCYNRPHATTRANVIS